MDLIACALVFGYIIFAAWLEDATRNLNRVGRRVILSVYSALPLAFAFVALVS